MAGIDDHHAEGDGLRLGKIGLHELAPAFLFRFSDLRIAISRQIDEVRLAVHAKIVDVDGLARLLTDARKIFALQHAVQHGGFSNV